MILAPRSPDWKAASSTAAPGGPGVELPLLQFANLLAVPGVVHGVTTRVGGVSEGRCATLNTSYTVGDEPDRVDENLKRLARAIGTERQKLVWAHQVHGNAATVVDRDTAPRPRCDVLLTGSRDRALLLRYADCTPILLADTARPAVAVAHAGWRGTALRAAKAAVQALQDAFGSDPRDLVAAIGPAIGPCCYEVGEEVAAEFADRPWALTRPNGERGRAHLDLWTANQHGLEEAGVSSSRIEVASICTRCQAHTYFSHRANGGQPAGRFAAVIRLD